MFIYPRLKLKDEMTIKFYNVSKHVKQQNKLDQWPRGINRTKLCRSQIFVRMAGTRRRVRSVNVKIWSGLKFYGWTKCERERAYWNTPISLNGR